MIKRIKRTIAWYHFMRKMGIEIYGKDQTRLKSYDKYNFMNCLRWAIYNASYWEPEGSWPYGMKPHEGYYKSMKK